MKNKSVGFPISTKENEKRRALIPKDISIIKNKDLIFVEKGYGDVLGYNDANYREYGINICSKEEVLFKDIICDPKIGDADYLDSLKENQTIFGWIHAVQNKDITDIIINRKISAFAWEEMYEDGRHVYYRNNEIAGEAAIFHAYLLHGLFPYDTKVAIIGRGNIARGALRVLQNLGAYVHVYDRKTENLFRKEIGDYDVVVNALLWDTTRKDHIIYKSDLTRMKKGAMIIDISCDRNGAVESCVPTSILNPVYIESGIVHYAVDHTPALFYKTITSSLSKIVSKYIDYLIEGQENVVLQKALIISNGKILDKKISRFQQR